MTRNPGGFLMVSESATGFRVEVDRTTLVGVPNGRSEGNNDRG